MLIILVLINLIFRYSLEKASKCKAINDPPDEPVRDPYIEFLPSSSLFSTPISSSSMSSISLLPKSSSSFIYDLHPLSHHWILTQGLPQNLGLESIFPNLISGTTCNWVMPYPSTALIPPDSKQKSLQMIFSSSPSKICIFQLLKFKQKCHTLGYFVILWDTLSYFGILYHTLGYDLDI